MYRRLDGGDTAGTDFGDLTEEHTFGTTAATSTPLTVNRRPRARSWWCDQTKLMATNLTKAAAMPNMSIGDMWLPSAYSSRSGASLFALTRRLARDRLGCDSARCFQDVEEYRLNTSVDTRSRVSCKVRVSAHVHRQQEDIPFGCSWWRVTPYHERFVARGQLRVEARCRCGVVR